MNYLNQKIWKDLFETFFVTKNRQKKSFIKKQPPEGFCKVFLKNSKAWNFIKKATPTQVFSGKFCEISKNTLFTEHLCNLSHSFISQRSFIYLFKSFFVRKMDKTHNFAIFSLCQYILYSLLLSVLYRSKHKHVKWYFVNEINELYL